MNMPDFRSIVSAEQVQAIRALPRIQDTKIREFDVIAALEFFHTRYTRQLPDFCPDITERTVIADVGCGVGWLAMALALATPARIIAYENHAETLAAARQIAGILKLGERIEFVSATLGDPLPLPDRAADIVFCVEVLEHIHRDPRAVHDLCRITRDVLVLTTPNLWFPAVAHDTRLPFCHWLPRPLRRVYARACGRLVQEQGNLFWSPPALQRKMAGFKRVSRFLHYAALARFEETFPFYLPYDLGHWVRGMGRLKSLYYRLAAALHPLTHWFMPNLAGTFRRNG